MSETLKLEVNEDGVADNADALKATLKEKVEKSPGDIEVDATAVKSVSTPVLAVLMQCVQSLLDNDCTLKMKVLENSPMLSMFGALGLDAGLEVESCLLD